MKVLFTLISLIFLSQESNLIWSSEFDYFKADNMGNLYLIDGEKITSINSEGELKYEYSNPSLGNISSMDQTSALRTILFYKDIASFVILDNTLSVQSGPISLHKSGLLDISLMCPSENNNYWCYDNSINSILKINQQLRIISSSQDLSLTLGHQLSPIQMIERQGKVYVNDPEYGIYILDNFGAYEKTIAVKGCSQIEVIDNKLYYITGNYISSYDLNSHLETSIIELSNNIHSFSIGLNILYYSNGKDIYFKKP